MWFNNAQKGKQLLRYERNATISYSFSVIKKHMNGPELAIEIANRKGEKKLSPGTIYPALKSLWEKRFISEGKECKIIVIV